MRAMKMVLVFAALASLTACEPIKSLHPFYTDGQTVFEPRLLGTWILTEESGKEQQVRFEGTAREGYGVQLDFTNDPGDKPFQTTLDGRLVGLGNDLYLDLAQSSGALNEFPTYYVLPFHTIYRVRVNGDQMELSFFDDDKIAVAIGSGALRMAHETVEGEVVLTASTQDLQKMAIDHPELLAPMKPLRRKQ